MIIIANIGQYLNSFAGDTRRLVRFLIKLKILKSETYFGKNYLKKYQYKNFLNI